MKLIKKFLKWTAIIFCIVLFCGLVFRGSIYRLLFSYKVIGHRTTCIATNKELIDYIDSKTVAFKPNNIREIIKFSLQLTSDKLNFKQAKSNNNPNRLIRTKNVHCIGYPAFFSTTCNYLSDKFGFVDSWSSEPLIGQVYFYGINIHPFFNSSFFEDHDFNSIKNKETGEIYFVDPTVNDCFRIDYVTLFRN